MVRNSVTVQAAALLLLALLFSCWNSAGAIDGADCCLTTVDKKIPQNLVKSYYIQTLDMGCRVPATIFVTKKGKQLCAPPATKNNWVKKLINKLNNKKSPKNSSKRRSK